MRVLLLAAVVLLFAAPVALGEGTIVSELARTHDIWANTAKNTPTVYPAATFNGHGTTITLRKEPGATGNVTPSLRTRLIDLPLPAGFHGDSGPDHEAVLTPTVTHPVYAELWTVRYGLTGWPGWSTGWGGVANPGELIQSGGLQVWPGYTGVQGSGIAFFPGLITDAEMRAGVANHPVQLEVPISCHTFKAPATRTDGVSTTNDPNCITLGQEWKLPAGTDCTVVRSRAGRVLCAAMRDYYLVATDQTHDRLTFRFAGRPAERPNPYTAKGGWFGCDGLFNGQPVTGINEFDCYPIRGNGAFARLPLEKLVPIN